VVRAAEAQAAQVQVAAVPGLEQAQVAQPVLVLVRQVELALPVQEECHDPVAEAQRAVEAHRAPRPNPAQARPPKSTGSNLEYERQQRPSEIVCSEVPLSGVGVHPANDRSSSSCHALEQIATIPGRTGALSLSRCVAPDN
jgi:hypothetical protein